MPANTINWLLVQTLSRWRRRKACGKIGPNASAAGFSAQQILLYAEPEAGALFPQRPIT
jgi:hypothetical protein